MAILLIFSLLSIVCVSLWSAPKFSIHINANIAHLCCLPFRSGWCPCHLQDPLTFRFGHQCLIPSKSLESFWPVVLYLQELSAMHTSIWLTDRRCSNPWQWRSQYLESRNLTFPDVRGFESLSLMSPAIVLQGHALYPSGCTTRSSRFVRPGEEQRNNLATLRKAGEVSVWANKPCWRREQR